MLGTQAGRERRSDRSVEIQRTGYVTKIALAAAFAVLMVVADIFVAVYLITIGRFPDFWSAGTLAIVLSVLLLLMETAAICFNVRRLIVRKRQAASVAARDPSIVEEASPQPDGSLALPTGESLKLKRRYSLNAVFRSLNAIPYMLWLVYFSEIVIFQVLPSFDRSLLNLNYKPGLDGPLASPPTALDWLAAALPLLLAASVFVYGAWQNMRDCFSQIVADDAGVTVRDGLRRRRIRWSEIDLFARMPDTATTLPLGTYVLWSHSQSLSFSIPGIEQEPDYASDIREWEARYVFAGGYNRYLQDVQRLLATIVARARMPLLIVHDTSGRRNLSRKGSAIASMTEVEALALPLAEPRYMPSGDPASGMLGEGEQISLRAHTWPLGVTGDWRNDITQCLIGILMLGWLAVQFSHLWPVSLAIVAIMTLQLTLYIILLMRQRRYNHLPDVRADESGLTTWGSSKDQPITIPWQSIAAWVVVPPKPGSTRPFRYVVVGHGLRLAWRESIFVHYSWHGVGGDPYKAYREPAMRLHALIAARTGLPLRQFRLDATPIIPHA